jgi:hypothetical protein
MTITNLVTPKVGAKHELSFNEPASGLSKRIEVARSFYRMFRNFSGVVHDKEEPNIGKSLFTHNNGQSSNSFYDQGQILQNFFFCPI